MSTNFSSDKIRSIKLKDKIYNIVGQPLHGTAAEWSNNDFTPQQGELVVYDADDTNAANVKIGDGTTALSNLPFVHTEGDNKEIYGVDTNKDGNVELIFGVKPLINFTITDGYGGVSFDVLNCQAKAGMTWEEWLQSNYNNIPDQVQSGPDIGIVIGGYNVFDLDGFTVHPADTIINNYNYTVSA